MELVHSTGWAKEGDTSYNVIYVREVSLLWPTLYVRSVVALIKVKGTCSLPNTALGLVFCNHVSIK